MRPTEPVWRGGVKALLTHLDRPALDGIRWNASRDCESPTEPVRGSLKFLIMELIA